MKIWKLKDRDQYPEGYKYSLYAVHAGKTVVGYDNHFPKGHHRHIGDFEMPYKFTDIQRLKNDFRMDLQVQLEKRGLV